MPTNDAIRRRDTSPPPLRRPDPDRSLQQLLRSGPPPPGRDECDPAEDQQQCVSHNRFGVMSCPVLERCRRAAARYRCAADPRHDGQGESRRSQKDRGEGAGSCGRAIQQRGRRDERADRPCRRDPAGRGAVERAAVAHRSLDGGEMCERLGTHPDQDGREEEPDDVAPVDACRGRRAASRSRRVHPPSLACAGRTVAVEVPRAVPAARPPRCRFGQRLRAIPRYRRGVRTVGRDRLSLRGEP